MPGWSGCNSWVSASPLASSFRASVSLTRAQAWASHGPPGCQPFPVAELMFRPS